MVFRPCSRWAHSNLGALGAGRLGVPPVQKDPPTEHGHIGRSRSACRKRCFRQGDFASLPMDFRSFLKTARVRQVIWRAVSERFWKILVDFWKIVEDTEHEKPP